MHYQIEMKLCEQRPNYENKGRSSETEFPIISDFKRFTGR